MPIPKLKTTKTNSVEIDYNQLIHSLKINTDLEVEKPPICIEIVDKGNRYRFGTLGNFSCIGGKGKARKGFFVSALLASAINNNKILKIKSDFIGKKVILFDTEQGDYGLYVSAKRSIRLNQLYNHPENFEVYALRQLSTEDRVTFIENYLENNENIGLIVIDGIRDLLVDINNTDQSTELTTKLMQWTKVYNIHISVVLHENPGSDKLRGHIGTEVTNKAETVVSIEKPKESEHVSQVIAKATRGTVPFDTFSFTVNEYGLPELSNYVPEF